MWDHNYIFLAGDDVPPDENLIEDEVDQLFMTRLPQLKPPPKLLSRILSTIAQLPGYIPESPEAEEPWDGQNVDGPVVRREEQNLR
ncbi:MAG: hypothetical protein M3Z08_08495 [Chloroflexota bacterium]|nr:hypothetical protein [Chloroflexota bacterium]